ncbi:protein FAR1-RELATED SEQUENCE 3-like [Helianthus annuus]|uniref:protein FAR1-RELATED SEQUENCE 3-like n=1 Tax=Helianthus annuus TaxID=4232 RepID=UPI000B9049C8|nr:protein FAR1-RELATED SEQUENCE 3-like [Helianthus annuus]
MDLKFFNMTSETVNRINVLKKEFDSFSGCPGESTKSIIERYSHLVRSMSEKGIQKNPNEWVKRLANSIPQQEWGTYLLDLKRNGEYSRLSICQFIQKLEEQMENNDVNKKNQEEKSVSSDESSEESIVVDQTSTDSGSSDESSERAFVFDQTSSNSGSSDDSSDKLVEFIEAETEAEKVVEVEKIIEIEKIVEAGSWKVYKFVEEHNHELVECPDKHFLLTERHLTQLQKHVIHSMSKLNLGPVKAFNTMKTCFGGFKDVGASKVEYKNYKRYSMVFVPFTGIDNHHCNVTFGATLLTSETTDTYIWLLRVFLKAVGFQPKVVVTDQDPAMKKAISVVGVRLCNSTNFKERICGVVWTDILTTVEFESEWEAVITEFNLADNDWLSDIIALRESWMPAYYRMEEMFGLMRTTSRSESENHFFGQVCNSKATLVEFMTHYETAIEAQRHTHRKNDHESRYKKPQLKSSYKLLEGQAVDIYTKSIFCDVPAELIGVVNCINQRYEDQSDGFVKFYVNDFQQPYKHSMHGVIEILFLVFFREFPKQYILNRWRKEASPNCSPEYSINHEYMTELDPDVQSMMRDIIFSTEYTLNCLSGNKEELSLYKDHVQSYMKKVQDMQIVAPPASTWDRFAEITGQYKNDKNPIRVPVGYKSKGSGPRKCLKSKQKIAINKKKSKSKPGAKERQCQNCKGYGHDASTCKQAVIKRRSTRS